MGAIVDLCDDDDDSPVPPPQQTAGKQPGKRLFGCLAGDSSERELLSPCKRNTEPASVPNTKFERQGFRVDAGTSQQDPLRGRNDDAAVDAAVDAALAPMPSAENRPIVPRVTNQDKVAARRAVLERKAVKKKAAREAEAAAAVENVKEKVMSPHMSPQLDGEDKKRQKQEQAAAKKAAKEAEKAEKAAQKEAEKAEKAAQKEQAKTAKAAESRARGTKADQEVTVLLDTALTKSKTKHAILDALEAHDVKFNHEVEPGKLPGWSTVTWKRNNSSMIAPGGACSVPYVMVVLDDEEAQRLLDTVSSVKSLLDSVIAVYGEVSVSLLLIGLQRTLVTQDRRDHTHAVRTGDTAAAYGAKKNRLLQSLLSLHFKHEGITYRDCHDAQQAAEHVVGITAAIAKQAYKGGHDLLAAFTKKGACGDRMESTAAAYNLAERQKTCAKTLCALDWGPKHACTVAQQFHTFGAVAQRYASDSQEACKSIAVMKTDTGRNVGPHAANKLHFFLSCEDPDAPFD